jgi:hypothetical protein
LPKYTHHYTDISDLKYLCFFCGSNRNRGGSTSETRKTAPTYIEFDLALHMLESHRMAMIQLPIGKGNMTVRVDYAVEQCKIMTQQLRKNPELWNRLFNITTNTTTSTTTNIRQQQQQEEEEFIDPDD